MKELLRLLVLGILSAASVGTAAAAPISWSGNGHSYMLVNSPGLTWEQAQADLQMQKGTGWHLATITSQEEHDWFSTTSSSLTLTASSIGWEGCKTPQRVSLTPDGHG